MIIRDNGDFEYDKLDQVLGKLERLHGGFYYCRLVGLTGDARDNASRAREICSEQGLAVPAWATEPRERGR